MCLAVFAYRSQARYRLILAANRDEYFNRATATAGSWPAAAHVWGGRDLRAGGTWLGVTRDGRIGWITNYRDPRHHEPEAPSRGHLVADYLTFEQADPGHYLEQLKSSAGSYNGFNLVLGNPAKLLYYSNRQDLIRPLAAGIYGLSNALLDTPWPKVTSAVAALRHIMQSAAAHHPQQLIEALFVMLADQKRPDDAALPDTGVGLELERFLAPVFISGEDYGTRSATVVLITHTGTTTCVERTFVPDGSPAEVRHQFREQVRLHR